jgi:lipopolysaccharide heptosyltransferase II
MRRILIIQTAFIGDVILALPVAQKLRAQYPAAQIEMLVRAGNEGLLAGHPAIDRVWVWHKRGGALGKYRNLLGLIGQLRHGRYEAVVNLHRFAASGFVTWLLRAEEKIGFAKNPFGWAYTKRYPHTLGSLGDVTYQHEVERNLSLLTGLVSDTALERPRLYPSPADDAVVVAALGGHIPQKLVVVAPASVWYTKQWPEAQWLQLLQQLAPDTTIALVGAPGDTALCGRLQHATQDTAPGRTVHNLAGKLSLLQTAALLGRAHHAFVNDSAPLHLASAMNTPTSAIFCSTLPEFGFGPLADNHMVHQVPGLYCRPCGLHGLRACPEGHFRCAYEIDPAIVAAAVG